MENFLSAEILLKTHGTLIMLGKTCSNPYPFFIIKRCCTNNWHATWSNKTVLNLQTSWIFSEWQQKTVWINQHMPLVKKSIKNLWNSHFQSTLLCLKPFPLIKKLLTQKWTPNSWNWPRWNWRWYNYWYCWPTDCHCGCNPYS